MDGAYPQTAALETKPIELAEVAPPPPPPRERLEDEFDQKLHAAVAEFSGGVSPWAALQAWEDWAYHLTIAPARAASLALEGWAAALRVGGYALSPVRRRSVRPFEPDPEDRRFRDEAWATPPFDALVQAQLAAEHVWEEATQPLPGVRAHHMRRVRFMGRQALQALAPSNFAWTNPTVGREAAQTGGRSLLTGAAILTEDMLRLASGRPPPESDAFAIGRALAPTPGRVVLRNDLMELIQYAPQTPTVRREPILIVPAWIMKYYILDLAPSSSLIEHLVREGFTVFCISWKNPGAEDHDKGLDDYRVHGVGAAIDAVRTIIPEEQIHAVGYCLGGTILAIAAAALDRDGRRDIRTLSLFAAQTDFSEAGELMMFIDESQLAMLEDLMNAKGYLDARQMAGAFYTLRANDMLWSRIVERYLLGHRRPPSPLDAWLTDATRMPARMHSEYLRWLFLENRFAQGNLEVNGGGVALKDLHTPIFAVGAERDHIAPWRSVYKIALFAGAETTFVLSGGGHNTAIVSPPGKPKSYYRVHVVGSCDAYVDPDDWMPETPPRSGSWWPEWVGWLGAHGALDRVSPPAMGAADAGYPPLESAPGRYVLEP